MNIFKSFTLTWWQGALFKWGIFLLGIAVGAFWPVIFSAYIPPLIIVAAALLAYVTYVWWKQLKSN
ncbi:MAG TPA: hypothetical protein VKB67_14365 [Rhizomicrobium sp.]|nr:hypothetical protein [Rhizomicrobium sp.]